MLVPDADWERTCPTIRSRPLLQAPDATHQISLHMNRMYQILRETVESHGVTGDDHDDMAAGDDHDDMAAGDDHDDMADTVVRDTLDKLFVQEVIHPDGDLDVDVMRAEAVKDSLVVHEAFTITSYSITDRDHEYRIDLSATHVEQGYTYRFRGFVQRSGEPAVQALRANVEPGTVTVDHR